MAEKLTITNSLDTIKSMEVYCSIAAGGAVRHTIGCDLTEAVEGNLPPSV